MPKVTFSNAKGILQEAGSGFQVNDAPILMESETIGTTTQYSVTPIVVDDDIGSTVIDLAGKFFTLPTPDGIYYVWFDGGDTTATDPGDAYGLDTAKGIRISDTTGAAGVIVSVELAVKAIVARILGDNSGVADGLIDYSDLDNVLGYDEADGVPTGSQTGNTDVSAILKATNAANASVTVDVYPIGAPTSTAKVDVGGLTGLGEDEDQDWTITRVAVGESTNSNGSALQAFGTSIVRQATAAIAGTATLANAAAGAKKFIRLDTAPGAGGSVVVSYTGPTGAGATLTFKGDEDYAYLLSNGLGWATLKSDLTP